MGVATRKYRLMLGDSLVGRTLRSGRRGRGFKSYSPSHFCYTETMDTFGGKEILYPGEMDISDDEMKFIELLLNEHFNKVAKLIYKIEHIRGELGEEEKAGNNTPNQPQQ